MRVVRYGNPILREKAEPVDVIDDPLKDLVTGMIEAMRVNGGIGLAAPQVAVSRSLFVIDMSLIEDDGVPMAVINPKIIEKEGEVAFEEGCLCIPDIREEVMRPEGITVTYQDIHGEHHEEQIDGLKARVFQHEIDHLNGVLFIDRIGPMKRRLLDKQLKTIAEEELSRI